MAGLSIPLLSPKTRIGTDAAGQPVYASSDFITYWNARFVPQLEKAVSDIAGQLQTLLQQGAQIDTVGMVATIASTTAATANQSANPSAPQRQATSASHSVISTSWVTVASVTFSSAPAASAVGLDGSGITGGTANYVSGPGHSQTGAVRVLRNGATVAGPVSYTLDDAGTLTFAGFTAPGADASTGTITYDLQVEKVSGINASASFLIDVTRTP